MDTDEPSFTIGSQVNTEKGSGKVAFYGPTSFATGKWVGVILEQPNGKNNGSVQGQQYFSCPNNHGIFVRPGQVLEVVKQSVTSKLQAPGTGGSGLKVPSTPKPKGLKEPSPTPSKVKPPGKSLASPRMTPAASMEKIKASPSVEKMNMSRSSSGSSDKLKPSPSQESLKSSSKPVSKLSKPTQAVKSEAAPPKGNNTTPSRTAEGVANKIQQMQEMNQQKNSEAILDKGKLSEGAELEYLRAETKDLGEKLETLRAKRQEDKMKLTEYERCKIQLQQLIEYKQKITEQHSELQRQLVQAQKDAREAIEAHSADQDDTGDLSMALEMATLDKEMAEEKSEILATELEQTKEKLTEVQVELELLQSEIRGETGSEGNVSDAIQFKQLQHQNEKLREALVKMRDVSAAGQADHQRLAKENERMKNEIQDMARKNDTFTSQNTNYEAQIQDLKEQVRIQALEDRLKALTEDTRQEVKAGGAPIKPEQTDSS